MLFTYKYVPHSMDRMQRFINFIFYQVWCRAHKVGKFHLELFDSNPDLKEVMTAFYYSDNKNADFFYGHIERIYDLFAGLSRIDRKQFKRWYQGNNNIQKICENDPATQIARYENIHIKHEELKKQLSAFFKGLYDNVDIAAFKNKTGGIDDHYKTFMRENTTGKCPFCGMSDILGVYHTTREAYDHYLPKTYYPFNSINFRNLVPACHHCNSNYKTTQDPAFTPKDPAGAVHRRKVFYPYANEDYRIHVTIDIKNSSFADPDDIKISFGPPALKEEIETWKHVYGIEERYKAKCCGPDAKDWLEEIRILRDSRGIDPASSFEDLRQRTLYSPFANCNFLKSAFLEDCHRKGILGLIRASHIQCT